MADDCLDSFCDSTYTYQLIITSDRLEMSHHEICQLLPPGKARSPETTNVQLNTMVEKFAENSAETIL